MKKDKKNDDIRLIEGSFYRMTSVGSRESPLISQGTFLGFTSIGSDEGICIRLDSTHDDLENTVRVIPSHMLLAVDLIKQKKDSDDTGEDDKTALYFG